MIHDVYSVVDWGRLDVGNYKVRYITTSGAFQARSQPVPSFACTSDSPS